MSAAGPDDMKKRNVRGSRQVVKVNSSGLPRCFRVFLETACLSVEETGLSCHNIMLRTAVVSAVKVGCFRIRLWLQ